MTSYMKASWKRRFMASLGATAIALLGRSVRMAAHPAALADKTGEPYPVVIFSHGEANDRLSRKAPLLNIS